MNNKNKDSEYRSIRQDTVLLDTRSLFKKKQAQLEDQLPKSNNAGFNSKNATEVLNYMRGHHMRWKRV